MGDATARDSAAPSPRVLVIFDYDWSLVNENSDTLVFHSLCPELVAEIATRRREQPSWTQLMDDLLGELVARQPHLSQEQIQDAVAQIPVQPRMLDALRMAVETFGAHVQIVSDANTVYIESMLALHDLHAYVKRVVTNPAAFEQGSNRLRVRPFHALEQPPHGCALCPTNMCKGRILDAIRAETDYDIVLYVGDGGGDFCPATRLTSRDVVFARDDDADGKPYGLLKKIRAAEDGTVQARVVPWRTGHDIYEQFTLVLQASRQ